ncbi:unnamed protein product [Clonostachys chloroleuca]|uniref:MaoC-like domain-containing protein n=1 Tax=Clonostachys chloroleuca TaxID=1926264 RepID=A0AA35M4X5_9HYPO|nr:unnamed protein product [Clonostachys chloroleuca]
MSEPWKEYEFPAKKVTWLQRDTLLFNLSIGCRADEPQFEGDPRFSTFPTYPLELVFKLDHSEVIGFYGTVGSTDIPGVHKLDPRGLVDGDRTVEIYKPLPTTLLGHDFEFRSKLIDVYDKGKSGIVVRSEDCLIDAKSGEYLFYVGQGNWGGPRGPRSDKKPCLIDKLIWFSRSKLDRKALICTASEVGKELGYGGIINHGVFGYNKIAHEMVRRLGNGDPSSMLRISAKFAGPVRPGDTLVIHLWKNGVVADGSEEVQWSAQVRGTGQECLCDGTAVIKPPTDFE